MGNLRANDELPCRSGEKFKHATASCVSDTSGRSGLETALRQDVTVGKLVGSS